MYPNSASVFSFVGVPITTMPVHNGLVNQIINCGQRKCQFVARETPYITFTHSEH